MSHRQKHRHKPRHRTHTRKPDSVAILPVVAPPAPAAVQDLPSSRNVSAADSSVAAEKQDAPPNLS